MNTAYWDNQSKARQEKVELVRKLWAEHQDPKKISRLTSIPLASVYRYLNEIRGGGKYDRKV